MMTLTNDVIVSHSRSFILLCAYTLLRYALKTRNSCMWCIQIHSIPFLQHQYFGNVKQSTMGFQQRGQIFQFNLNVSFIYLETFEVFPFALFSLFLLLLFALLTALCRRICVCICVRLYKINICIFGAFIFMEAFRLYIYSA